MTREPPRDLRHDVAAPHRRRAPLVGAATSGSGKALDLTVEFLAAILTWGGVGWLLDRWLGTGPWLLVFGLVLGNGCGIALLAFRAREDERGRAQARPGAPQTKDDENA